jgi:cysteine-rich repeat protein
MGSTCTQIGRFGALAAFLAAASMSASIAVAHEGDHWPIAGDSLQMSYTDDNVGNKFSFKSRDQLNINTTSLAQDPTSSRTTLIVRGSGIHAGSTGVIELDSAYWKPIGPPDAPKGWKYKNPNLALPSEQGVSKIQLKTGPRGGSVQIQGKGRLWPFPITGSQDSIEVVLGIGEFAFCAEFSADREADFRANDEGKVSASGSLAPTGCPQVCGNGILETGEQCDDGNDIDGDTCTNTCEGCDAGDVEFASTYEGIQQLIFDSPVYGCSNDACHGSLAQGGLDLRAGTSHGELVGIASLIAPATKRVFPGDQDLSMLYQKLAEKTLGTPDAPGTAMPSGGPAISEDYLEAIRLWIRGGAPEIGVVAGTAELLGSCLPSPTPLDIPQPEVPAPTVGTQFAQPGYNLQSESEIEGCVASYYDLSAPGAVPANMVVDCPGAFPGTNETGTNPGKCFTYKGNELFQDAQSHHSIIHIYSGDYSWNDPGWGSWRCYGGPTPDAACDPSTANSCGTDGVCGSRFHNGVACLGFWGAPDFSTFGNKAPQFSGSQESTADFAYPEGVYSVLPLKGLIIWNSHAFNLTTEDTEMEAWLNMTYTDQRTWPAQGLFNSTYIFTQEVLPFEQEEYCATHTFPENAHLFQLTSHTHKRGIRWRYFSPPQTPCGSGGTTAEGAIKTSPACLPGAPGDMFYDSYDYSDPVTQNYDPPKVYSGTTANRTIKFCGVFDNGLEDPATVKTQSGSPVPTNGNALPGGPCADEDTYCNGGPNKGQACFGNDANCPGSVCDACMLTGGVTTEDEMFIAIGTYYIP